MHGVVVKAAPPRVGLREATSVVADTLITADMKNRKDAMKLCSTRGRDVVRRLPY